MKDRIMIVLFLGYIFIFSILHIILPDKSVSSTERRKLAKYPSFELTSDYISKVDKYFLDHFPFRDDFRSIKANFNYKILNKLDNNDIYLKDNYIFKSDYPINKKSIDKFISTIDKFKKLSKNNNMYLMIIPDKNFYLDDSNFLNLNYEYIYEKLYDDTDMKTIDIRNIMSLDDYYETDTHWKQENLEKVIFEMSKVMNFNYEKENYIKNIYDKFYGVYYGLSAINREPETITYLTNDIINSVEVKYLENDKLTTVYNLDNLKSLDAYEVYLDGASSFIEIYNNNSKIDRELVIFRDSFASSITPLLIKYYSKITLIDNRYINSDNFLKLIEFNNQDVLFMYSTLIVNDSSSLKG